MSDPKSVGVVGAGATGAYLAARLTEAGIPVTLVARGQSLEHIRAHGIEIIDPDGVRLVARPHRVLAAEEVTEPVDYALFCVKGYDTEDATAQVGALLGDHGRVVCLQNGVKNEQILAQAFGAERVLSGVLYIGSQRTSPGVISCSALPRVLVGPYRGEDVAAATEVHGLLEKAGIDTTVKADVLADKWQKFLFNCGLNPLTAMTGLKLGRLLALPASAGVYHALVDEALAVAVAAGAPLPAEARDNVTATGHRMDISSSMAEDLEAGRAIELDSFTGYVIELGEQHDVATPATRVAHGVLAALDSRRAGSSEV